jgi:murein DD-endopeptidase MepM/ murein hydrolase activator NlpD
MSALLCGRLLLLAWSWRRVLAVAAAAAVAIPALAAAGLITAMGPVPSGDRLLDPLPMRLVTQPFGCTGVAIEPANDRCPGGHFHSGIDLAAPLHTPVRAATAGVAASGQSAGGYGLWILVQRDPAGALATLYGHLSVTFVSSGDLVQAGQLIGLVGSSGNSTGPHLHLEVRVRGVPVDPAPYLPPPRPGGGG